MPLRDVLAFPEVDELSSAVSVLIRDASLNMRVFGWPDSPVACGRLCALVNDACANFVLYHPFIEMRMAFVVGCDVPVLKPSLAKELLRIAKQPDCRRLVLLALSNEPLRLTDTTCP